jgi:hypothetical protein
MTKILGLLMTILFFSICNTNGFVEAATFIVTPFLNVSSVKIKNKGGNSGLISITGIKTGDIIKVYNSKRQLLYKSQRIIKSSIYLNLKELGIKAGKIYIDLGKGRK